MEYNESDLKDIIELIPESLDDETSTILLKSHKKDEYRYYEIRELAKEIIRQNVIIYLDNNWLRRYNIQNNDSGVYRLMCAIIKYDMIGKNNVK